MNNNFEFKDWSGFRPLSGSYISQSEEAALRYKLIKGFRPLSGSYISQLGHLFIGAEMGGGFRPLSGSYISQWGTSPAQRAAIIKFPSPIGELHFSIISFFSFHFSVMWVFPSPIGELHFSILLSSTMDLPCTCFRPLSGSYISQLNLLSQPATLLNVSVPYRGATFLNDNSTIQGLMDTSFPSPIGELHFSMNNRTNSCSRIRVSVPYRGATFLNGISGFACDCCL